MAEKRFAGAPFGTQTARFDVTGVHPKNKVPGSFTQIPYDKYSMLEQKIGSHLSISDADRIAKVDCRLQNIRFALKCAEEDVKKVKSMKKSKSCIIGSKRSNNKKEHIILLDALSSSTNFTKNRQKDKYAFKDLKDFQPLEPEQMDSQKNVGYLSLHQKDAKQCQMNEKVDSHKNLCLQKIISCDVDMHLVSFNTSGNSMNMEGPHQTSEENLEKDLQHDIKDDEILSSEQHSVSVSSKRVSFSGENIEGIKQLSVQHLSNSVTEINDTSIESIAVNEVMQTTVESPMKTSNVSMQTSCEPEKNASLVDNDGTQVTDESIMKTKINSRSSLASTRSGGSETEVIDKSLLPKIMTNNFNIESTECIVPQNSTASIQGHKLNKMAQQRKLDVTCNEYLKRKLGPGTYNTVVGGFSPSRVEQRASGPGWARQLEVERLAALPHLLYKEQWEENKMLKRKLGPGSYEIKDFIQAADLKPRSSKGVCENLASRFDKGVTSFTPGPGTYGKGGVPQRATEEKGQQSISTKGMLDSGDRKRNLPSVGSHLGPGTYRHKTCTEEMLNKVTSLRGPYELYSGDRNKPISEGYQAAPKLADLGPGQYEIGSFVDDLHSIHRKSHGVFGKMTQYPEVPTERLFLFSQAHYPKRKNFPGPGAYSIQDISKPEAINSPGFLSSAKRDDKLSQKFFTRNFNPVGAGRYDIQKFDDAQDMNGHTSVFRSKTGKPNLQMAKFLQERIRSKDVPVENRMFITDPGKPAMCRAVTVL